jgi:hypothetical protein
VRVLLIDIETSPISADVWELWRVNVGLSQIREPTRMICFAAKWLHEPKIQFYSEWQHTHEVMVGKAHDLLSEADAVGHYNGERFDVPHLNREFLLAGLGPPAPYQQIDYLRAIRKQFRFPSNKLAYISAVLGYEGKLAHEGHSLWIKVLDGDPKAQRLMRKYNMRDVECLEELHDRLLPWIPGLPNQAVYSDKPDTCPRCGSPERQSRGFAYTRQGKYQRYQCQGCRGWYSDAKRVSGATVRPVAA